MNTFTQKHLWKLALVIIAAIGMSSCETVDQGRAKWEGMDKKQQNTIIGGLGGAAVGAIVSGKKATGAIIGGAAGALGGRVYTAKKQENEGLVE